MKALILTGGKGTRLRPLTNTTAKHLLPVANKPILFYGLEQIQEAGIRETGIVVSPETGPEIKAAVGDGSQWGMKVDYILQTPALGLAHAVSVAREYLADSSFLLFLGDNLIQDGVKVLVDKFKAESLDALITLKEVADPRAFGVAEIDPSGRVLRLVEKPQEPKSNLAVVGAYIFTPEVHPAIAQLKPSWRGEYEITDAIQKLVEGGKEVRSHVLRGWWLDTGKKDDLLQANRTLLDSFIKAELKGTVDAQSQILGSVQIAEGARIEKSVIQGPAAIGANCRVTNSTIGPYASIGAETTVENSTIENMVVLSNSRILNIKRLSDSVIGKNVEIVHQEKASSTARFFIGDYDRVEL